ncbi:Predicted HD superfamily hydrolase [Chlamydia trachomatis]|nr:Predicted HD superfamily hydrolase [Chlamydia trachomatis]
MKSQEEGADTFICQLTALLHDVADQKIACTEEAGLQTAREWLELQELLENLIVGILDSIQKLSFKRRHATRCDLVSRRPGGAGCGPVRCPGCD